MNSGEQRSLLIEEYVRGDASPETIARLESELREDAEFRRDFLDYLNLDLGLALQLSVEKSEAESKRNIVSFPSPGKTAWLASAAAVAALLVAGSLWWFRPVSRAEITRVIGIEENTLGKSIGGERIEIARGILELQSTRGARIVIEAPATFQFESEQTLRLFSGRLAAEVPESAHGFTVLTPSGKAIDLGTEFGVDVPLEGEPEIHVFDGEVVAHANDGQPLHLHEGDAFTLTSGGGLTRDLRSAAFVRPEEISLLQPGTQIRQKALSEDALSGLKEDPDLVVLLDFEGDEPDLEGQYRTCQGRWPGSRALEFVSEGDHLKLNAGRDRDWPRLTLAAWVRLDRLGAPYQSLLHTDGWDANNPGQVHWMITHLETMRLALRGNTLAPLSQEKHQYPDSKTSVLPEKGRWVHLATVYDAEAGTVRFYLNGRFDNESKQDIAHPARLGAAQIGNWNRNDRKLSGRVDELLILGRCLGDEEIRSLFESGNPYHSVSP